MNTPHVAEISRERTLLRVLGLGFGLAVIIGNSIGAGIFRAPAEVAGHLPAVPLFLAAWVAGGLYALLGALQIAELSAMLPLAGGQYVFVRHALGEYAGFIVGWSDWLSTCGTAAAVALVIGEFATGPVGLPRGAAVAAAAGLAVAFAAIQTRGIRWGSAVQNFTSALKALILLLLVAAGFAIGGAGPDPSPVGPAGGLALGAAFVLALQPVIYTYDGWTAAIYFSEEIQEAGRNVPRALVGGVISLLAIYLLVNVSLLAVLPLSAIAESEFAIGAAASAIFGAFGDPVTRTVTIVALLSALNSNHLMASRTLFAMSRDELFWRRATSVNEGGTPVVALVLSAAVALLFILFGRTFEQVITVLAFFFVANYTLSFTSVFVLRRREPERPRPYRAWGYPWTTGLALAGSVLFLGGAVAGDTRHSVCALLLLAASYPAFRLTR
jgi:APA family basic amino acid/polyamine antiporter